MNYYIVIPTLKEYPAKAVESVMKQKVKCKTLVAIDDTNTEIYISRNVTPDGEPFNDFFFWKRAERNYMAKNVFEIINTFIAPHAADTDVICILDGDDDELKPHALEVIRAAYNNPRTWLTHGSYERVSGDRRTFNGPYRANVNVRRVTWRASHLKTFRYGLWKHLPESALKGPDGKWLRVCGDMAIMFPLIEMAGLDRVRYIKHIIYRYNDMSPLNDHKTDAKRQIDTDKWLRAQKPFQRLEAM